MKEIFLAVVAGCGDVPTYDHYKSDPEFRDLIHEWQSLTGKRAVPMTFGNHSAFKKPQVLGICQPMTPSQFNYIIIKREKWNYLSDIHKWVAVMHEQGHCAYGYGHTDGFMRAYLPPEKEVLKFWDEWTEEYLSGEMGLLTYPKECNYEHLYNK